MKVHGGAFSATGLPCREELLFRAAEESTAGLGVQDSGGEQAGCCQDAIHDITCKRC